jgi:hypothetical protein
MHKYIHPPAALRPAQDDTPTLPLTASYRSRDQFPAMITWTLFAVKKNLDFMEAPGRPPRSSPPLNPALFISKTAELHDEWITYGISEVADGLH